MRNVLIFLGLGVLAWQGYSAYQARAGRPGQRVRVVSMDGLVLAVELAAQGDRNDEL